MRLRRLVPWVVAVAAFAALGYAYRSEGFKNQLRTIVGAAAVLECPSFLDLGEQNRGAMVVAKFTLHNRGGSELEIHSIRTSCACSGLEQVTQDGYLQLETLRVPPHEAVDVAMRIRVTGEPGSLMRNLAFFRTNDPSRPEVVVEATIARVRGILVTAPATILFGDVLERATSSCVCDLWTHLDVRLESIHAESSAPEAIDICLAAPAPAAGALGVPDEAQGHLGRKMARLEVTLREAKLGEVREFVRIWSDSHAGAQCTVPVVAKIVPALEIVPQTLVLPRKTASGEVFDGTCCCRNRSGTEMSLKVLSAPDGCVVEILPNPDSTADKLVVIHLDPQAVQRIRRSAGGGTLVRLTAVLREKEVPLSLSLVLRREESAP